MRTLTLDYNRKLSEEHRKAGNERREISAEVLRLRRVQEEVLHKAGGAALCRSGSKGTEARRMLYYESLKSKVCAASCLTHPLGRSPAHVHPPPRAEQAEPDLTHAPAALCLSCGLVCKPHHSHAGLVAGARRWCSSPTRR